MLGCKVIFMNMPGQPMPRGAWSSRNRSTLLLFGAVLSFFKAHTGELENSPIARVPCDG